jgi:hypothetical protein
MQHYEEGQAVRLSNGATGVVYKRLPRAAASIKAAWKEAEFDRTPYSVKLDRDGSFTCSLGDEMTKIASRNEF